MSRAPLYRLLRPIARVVVRLFHRRVTVEHAERVPRTGGVVVVANHPNMLLDVLLLATAQPRTLRFLAKATLFESPILAPLLKTAGVLPVHRRHEGSGGTGRNLDTFEACHELLAQGGALAIFPEGVSHDRDAVLPLKTGAARIVLEAEAKRNFELGLVIVPAGLNFSNRELFRSDALVYFGKPIDPSHLFDAYRRGEEAEAVRSLTSEMEDALKTLAPHVPREDDEKLIETLRQFFTEAPAPSAEGLVVDKTLVEAVSDFRDRHPVDYARLRRQVLGYGRVLDMLGLTHERLERRYRLGPVLKYLLPRLFLAILGFVPFLAGALVHYLPYKIPAWVSSALSKDSVERGTTKLVTGLVTFPLAYLFLVAASGRIALLVVLPLLGIFSLLYLEAMSELWREARVLFLHIIEIGPDRRLARVMEWRRTLVAELEERRVEYESALVEKPPPE